MEVLWRVAPRHPSGFDQPADGTPVSVAAGTMTAVQAKGARVVSAGELGDEVRRVARDLPLGWLGEAVAHLEEAQQRLALALDGSYQWEAMDLLAQMDQALRAAQDAQLLGHAVQKRIEAFADAIGTGGGGEGSSPTTHPYPPGPPVGASRPGPASDQTKIDSYRTATQAGKGKNIAVASYQIDGHSGEVIATSGGHPYPGAVPMPERPQFTATRAADSEWKLLEHLARGRDRSATGTIRITSERPVCDSCKNVIEQFRRAFPGIRVTYSDLGRGVNR